MERYSIRDAEQLTGIKAHTLRVWEKRYQTLIPHRTGTNIRYYDDEQLRRLLNIATLQQQGYRISQLMEMDDAEMHQLLLEASQAPHENAQAAIATGMLVNAMLAFDEPMFDKVFSSTILRLGMYEAVLQVIYPFLRKTGVLWSINNTSPAQEHFASNLVRRKISAALDGIPHPRQSTKKFLLFLPPDELHEIGLMVSDYIIRNAGHETIYLGQDLPYAALDDALKKIRPTHLLTFFTAGSDLSESLKKLAAMTRGIDCTVLICSPKASPARIPSHVKFLQQPDAIFDYL